MLQYPGLGQAKARTSIKVSTLGGKGPSACTTFWCFPRYISRKMDQKWSIQYSNQCSYRMMALQVIVSPATSAQPVEYVLDLSHPALL